MGLTRLSAILARHIWAGMLWFMRRPRIKRMRRRIWERWPEPRRTRIKDSIQGQDRWALRYGRRIVTVLVAFALGSLLVFSTYYLALWLVESGALTMPPHLRESPR